MCAPNASLGSGALLRVRTSFLSKENRPPVDTGIKTFKISHPLTNPFHFFMPSPAALILKTDRLNLTPLTPHDSAPLFAIQSDPEVMRYWNHAPWTDIRQAEESILKAGEALASNTAFTMAIRDKESSTLIGTCLLFSIDEQSARGEIGYNLAQNAQGKGYMTEALQRLIDFAFLDLRLRRLEAEIDPRNLSSARLLERLGFRQEGLLRERWIVEGEVSESAIYGLLANDRLPVPSSSA